MFDSPTKNNDPNVINVSLINTNQSFEDVKKADIKKIIFEIEYDRMFEISIGDIFINQHGVIVGKVDQIIFCNTNLNVTKWNFAVFISNDRHDDVQRVPLGEIHSNILNKSITTIR